MDLTCRRCQTPLSVDDLAREQKMIACPNCRVVNGLATGDEISPSELLPESIQKRGLPKGISVEELDDKLYITRSWFSNQAFFFLIFGLFWNGFLIFFASQTGPWIYLMPHGWVGLWFLYKAITGLLNTTVIEVSPDRLNTITSPIPSFSDKKLSVEQIDQLYVERKVHKNKNSTSYTYNLELLRRHGGRQTLVKGMTVPQQALYLEYAIEQHLGISDRATAGEYRRHSTLRKVDGWQRLAKYFGLSFTKSKVLEGTRVFGDYQGFQFDMAAFRKGESENSKPYTGISLVRRHHSNDSAPSGLADHLSIEENLEQLFTWHDRYRLKGHIEAREGGRELYYEQPEIENGNEYLKFLIYRLGDLMDGYPRVMSLGSAALSRLKPIATDNQHPLQKVALQLMRDIGPRTMHLEDHLPQLVCETCLTGFQVHRSDLNWPDVVTYCGCRTCHQSNLFYSAETVVAVLDRQMESDIFQSEQTLNVNWLQRRSLFDFEAVEIRRAEDKDAEQFAMQIGNDTDPIRTQRYAKMTCTVSPFCNLSKNTLRILERTFAQVTITPLLHDVDGRAEASGQEQGQSYQRLQSDQSTKQTFSQPIHPLPNQHPPLQTNKE